MKTTFLFTMALLLLTPVFGQSDIEQIVSQGIELHDAGKYQEAVDTYAKALAIDSLNGLVHYEMSLSYFSMKDFEKCLYHSEKTLASDDTRNMVTGVITGQ